jgi:hypothetical protein
MIGLEIGNNRCSRLTAYLLPLLCPLQMDWMLIVSLMLVFGLFAAMILIWSLPIVAKWSVSPSVALGCGHVGCALI